MRQRDRIRSVLNDWEADPWDTSDTIADAQLAGFELRASKPIEWTSIRSLEDQNVQIFGIEQRSLIDADVEFYATDDGEDMLLMRLAWHGFPDPPEWRLATRPQGQSVRGWSSWGYFADLPQAWKIPENSNAKD